MSQPKEQKSGVVDPVGYVQLFRQNHNFRRYFFSHIISLFGDWFNILAILALLRSMGHDGAGAFGGVFIAKSLATLSILPVGGVIVDALSRKKVMLFTDWGRAFIVMGMFSVIWFPSPWVLYTLLWLQSALTAFFDPAKRAILPDIVSKEELPAANALNAVTWSLMLSLGSGLGGLVVEAYGWQVAMGVDVLSYLVSGILLMGVVEPSFERKKIQGNILAPLKEGWQYIMTHPKIRGLVSLKMMWGIMGSASVILAMLAEGKYRMAEGAMIGVSFLFIARGLGTGIGPIVARWIAKDRVPVMEAMLGYSFLWALIFYAPLPFVNSIWMVAILVLLAHLGGATIWVFSTLRLQQLVPTEVRGRVFSWDLIGYLVMHCFSIWLFGVLIDQHGLAPDMALSSAAYCLIIPFVLWTFGVRKAEVRPSLSS